jgi:hypothetical protein
MEEEGKIIEELLSQDLKPETIEKLRRLQNRYGSLIADLKEEIRSAVEKESAYDNNALIPVSRVYEIILKAGKEL